MNSIAYVFLAVLVLRYLLLLIADSLNRAALRRPCPPEVADLYPPEVRERTASYLTARIRVATVESTFELGTLLAFWGLGGFGWWDEVCRRPGWGEVPTGLLFIGGLVLLQGALSLPFQLWRTFGVEARFGFNRTTPVTFVADLIKTTLLLVVLGGPLLAAVLWLFGGAGRWAWLGAWGVTALFTLAVQWVIPTWILPLFYRFSSLEDPDLRTAILSYASSVDFPLQDLYVVDGSRRSNKGNAFFTGLGRNRRVALFDTLIAEHTEPELVAVVAHEIGHYRLGHVPRMLAISLLHTGVLFALLGLALPWSALYEAFHVSTPSVYAGLVFFGLLYTPVELALSVAVNALSRRHEFQADRFAARTTGSAEELGNALRRLSADHLAHPSPHPFWVRLHASHPPLVQRLRALAGPG